RIYFTCLSNKFIKFNRIEGKCLRFTEKIQDYIFKLRIQVYRKLRNIDGELRNLVEVFKLSENEKFPEVD
ncbi:MAG: hypothetical protein Q8O41_05315, partial [Candidatus Methanoperedens sp.]|nr:hypothetical protein [Candidatus Methanoperedens sp.]